MMEHQRASRPTGLPFARWSPRGRDLPLRTPYAVHALLVLLGVLAIATTVRTAQRYTGLSLVPPEPRTLVPRSAATYTPISLHPESPATRQALDHLAATTGLARGRIVGALELLDMLGDHVGIAEWPPSSAVRMHALALVAQIKLSDAIALTQNAKVKPRVESLRRGMRLDRVIHEGVAGYTGVTIYRITFLDGGHAYACIVAGDGVLATDLATVNRIIRWNQR